MLHLSFYLGLRHILDHDFTIQEKLHRVRHISKYLLPNKVWSQNSWTKPCNMTRFMECYPIVNSFQISKVIRLIIKHEPVLLFIYYEIIFTLEKIKRKVYYKDSEHFIMYPPLFRVQESIIQYIPGKGWGGGIGGKCRVNLI